MTGSPLWDVQTANGSDPQPLHYRTIGRPSRTFLALFDRALRLAEDDYHPSGKHHSQCISAIEPEKRVDEHHALEIADQAGRFLWAVTPAEGGGRAISESQARHRKELPEWQTGPDLTGVIGVVVRIRHRQA